MKSFKQFFLEEIRQKLGGFENSLSTNKELKAAHDLCLKIEELNPGLEALIVGGAVRDLVLGKQPHDVDIATNVDIDTLANQFKSHDIGKSKSFGIVVIPFEGFQFEVAHYREDVGSSDHRRPDSVKLVKSFEKDSSRRDFTINSLGLNTNGEIVDYHNGLEAINKKLISTVGVPEDRFFEDYLRVLRAVRFAVKLGYQIEDNTKRAMKDFAKFIPKISPERIKEELFKVAQVSGKALADYIIMLDDIGILQILLPEIKEMQKYEHNPIHHPEGNCYQHTIKALESSKSNDPLVNISILFHDVGKPATAGVNDLGQPIYHGHEEQSVKIFQNIAKRLKFSNEEISAISFVIDNHMRAFKLNEMNKNKILQLRQSPYWDMLKQMMFSDQLARGGSLVELNNSLENVEKMIKTFGEKQQFEKRMSELINGSMIINKAKELGYEFTKTNSQYIGMIKDKIRKLIIDKDFNITPQEVQKYLEDLINSLKTQETPND